MQAPQLEVSQPQWVPVRPGVSRMKWTSSVRGSTSRVSASPLIVTVPYICPGRRMEWASRGAAQGAFGEHAREVALVVGRAATVGHRHAVLGGDLAGLDEQLLGRDLAAQQLLGAGHVDRRRADRAERDADVRDRVAVEPDARRGGRDGEVPRAPLDLL